MKCFVTAQYANLPLIPPYLQPGDHQFMDGENFESKGDLVLAENLPGMVCLSSCCFFLGGVFNVIDPHHFSSFYKLIKLEISLKSSKGIMRFNDFFKEISSEIRQHLQSSNHRFINGVNFASSGAGALVETHHGWVCQEHKVYCLRYVP